MQIQNKTFACYNIDDLTRLVSSSGAIFSLLAAYVLSESGVVYGVAMSDDCYSATYIPVTNIEDVGKLRGSKYLQAKIGDIFKDVRFSLEKGKTVLFTGTACQINGLKKFLMYSNTKQENLYCVDVICHGVPSPALWKKYVEYREKQNNGKLYKVNFRCKDNSWVDFGMKEMIGQYHSSDVVQKTLYISKRKDPYMQMFLHNYSLRPSCYECMVKNNKHSDITIGDFWGIGEVAPKMNDRKGTSLVIIKNNKGAELFSKITDSICMKEVSYEDGIKHNLAEHKSVAKPIERDTFFVDFNNMSFEELWRKYDVLDDLSLKRELKRRVKSVVVRLLRGGEIYIEYGLQLMLYIQK